MVVFQLILTSLRMPPERRHNFPHYGSLTLPLDPVRYLHLDLRRRARSGLPAAILQEHVCQGMSGGVLSVSVPGEPLFRTVGNDATFYRPHTQLPKHSIYSGASVEPFDGMGLLYLFHMALQQAGERLRRCQHCPTLFVQARRKQRFCTRACQQVAVMRELRSRDPSKEKKRVGHDKIDGKGRSIPQRKGRGGA